MTAGDRDATALAGQVARLYFDRGLSKVEIAARLGISRFRAARLLEHARATGLVRIEFRDGTDTQRALAASIEQRWGIDLCLVAAGAPGTHDDALPCTAASLIAELIGPGEKVGIAWGSTLAAVVDHLPARTDPTTSVVQLAGSSTRIARDRTPGELARRLAERLGASYHPLFAPAFVETAELRRALCAEPEIRATLDLFPRLTLAIVGIGALAPVARGRRSSLVASGVLGDADLASLISAGAVGDLILRPYDAAGRFVASDLTERAIGITLEQLDRVPRVVAVAGGAAKAVAIAGALRTGLIDVLVTDTEAAQNLTHR